MAPAESERVTRCRATMACRPTDRVATYMPAIACGVASEVLGREVHTGTGSLHYAEACSWDGGEAGHAEFVEGMLADVAAIHRALDVDVVRMPHRFTRRPERRIDQFTFLFGADGGPQEVWKYDPVSADFGLFARTGPGEPPEEALRRQVESGEAATDADRRAAVATTIADLRRLQALAGEEFFVIGATAGITAGLREDDLLMLALQPDLVRRRSLLQGRSAVAVGEALAEARLPGVILGGGDLAGAGGLMYSPEMFRRSVLPGYVPAMRRLNAMGCHYFFRSDGDIWPLMEMLFTEAACPGFGEVDYDAGMTAGAIRARFPRLVLWGNVSSKTLVHGTPASVRDHCRRIIDESQGVGYFHGCSNAIVKGTPPANVEAMFSVR